MENINTLLFDLGGVLVELGPVDQLVISNSIDPQTAWEGWISSETVRRFESGACSAQEFARSMVREFDLVDSPDVFLERFRQWPRATYRGAERLLGQLREKYRVCCLSNTNSYHYEHFLRDQPIMDHFEHQWLSHLTGILKPEPAAFQQVLEVLDTPAESILFLDDNPVNVSAARQAGLRAELVKAPDGVVHALKGLDLVI